MKRRFFRLGIIVLALTAMLVGAWRVRCRAIATRQARAREAVLSWQADITRDPASSLWIANSPLVERLHPPSLWPSFAEDAPAQVVTEISFDVRSYDDGFEEPSSIDDERLALLAELTDLQALSVPRSRITDAGLKHLAACRSLRTLDLSHTSITARGLAALQTLTSLETLVLDGLQSAAPNSRDSGLRDSRAASATLEPLAHLPRLGELSLRDVSLTDVSALNRIKSLRSLLLASPTLRKIALSDLPVLRQLTLELSADSADVSLTRLPKIERLTVRLMSPDHFERLQLSDLPELVELDLVVSARADVAPHLVTLTRLPKLRKVTLRTSGSPAVVTARLSNCSALRELTHSSERPAWSDDASAHLVGLVDLRRLELGATRLSDVGLQHVATLAGLEHLRFESQDCTDAGMAPLARLASLRSLEIHSRALTKSGVERLSALSGLRTFRLTGLRTDADLGPTLARFDSLESLALRSCRFPSLTLADSPRAKPWKLASLSLAGCEALRVTIEDVASLTELSVGAPQAQALHIRRLAALRRLDVSLSSHQMVQEFALSGLPKLEWLSIQCGAKGARVPEETFAQLHTFKALRAGIVWGLEMPPAARADLDALPPKLLSR